MKKNTVLSESLEDYLEVILALEQAHKVARVKDIAEKIGVQLGLVISIPSLRRIKLRTQIVRNV
jgi:Mn-dependent DtxR family transcriptional regulator